MKRKKNKKNRAGFLVQQETTRASPSFSLGESFLAHEKEVSERKNALPYDTS